MCHRVYDEHAVPRPERAGAVPGKGSQRPRWLVGAAVTMAGGLALAAWVDLQPARTGEVAQPLQRPGAMASVPVQTAARTGSGPADRLTLVDDEVPTSTGTTRAAAGHCEHGM